MKEVPIVNSVEVALVDDQDYEKVTRYTWHLTNGYAKNSTVGYMHNFILDAFGIDHINGNKLDNRWKNLRLATQQQNLGNSGSRGGTSRFKGVSWHSSSRKWRACITVNYKTVYLGLYATEEAAALAYNDKAREVFGEFARLNEL